LLFQRIANNDLESNPGIWILDIDTGEASELVAAGMQPVWLAKAVGD